MHKSGVSRRMGGPVTVEETASSTLQQNTHSSAFHALWKSGGAHRKDSMKLWIWLLKSGCFRHKSSIFRME